MKFGIDLYPHYPADMGGSEAFRYAIKQTRAARESGFDGIFASHHYAMGPDEGMFQPVPLLARLAAEAEGMTMGTAVYLLSLHNPVEAAELAANLDVITGGRFVFGVGQGYRDEEFDSFGIPKACRGMRLEESIRVIRKLWSQDRVTWDGEFFRIRDVSIAPKPLQQPGPPIWVGGDTLRGVRRAAEAGDAWLTSPRHSKVFLREALEAYKTCREGLGLPAPPPVFFREMFVSDSREAAERTIRDSFERLYQVYHKAGQPGERYNLDFEQLKGERIIVGDPDDVTEQIQQYRDEFGAEYMFFRVYYLGMDPEDSVKCIELFGREVIPNLSGLAAEG